MGGGRKKGLTFLLIFISSPLEAQTQLFNIIVKNPDTYISRVRMAI